MRTLYLPDYQKLLHTSIISFYILILLMISSINKFIIYVYYFLLANQLTSIKKDWDNSFRKRNNIRKLSNIPRGFSRYVDRAIYSEGIFGILFRKYYIGSPLLSSELDVWRLKTDMIETLIKLFRFGSYVSEKRRRFGERRILNFFFFRELREASVQSSLYSIFS
jgi:hypothetical protein